MNRMLDGAAQVKTARFNPPALLLCFRFLVTQVAGTPRVLLEGRYGLGKT
jgi:hypothetical protein